jgi:hypothetical protein
LGKKENKQNSFNETMYIHTYFNDTLISKYQNLRNSFLRGFPLPFNVETLQAFGALFQIPHYYRKFSHCKLKIKKLNMYIIHISIKIRTYVEKYLKAIKSTFGECFISC